MHTADNSAEDHLDGQISAGDHLDGQGDTTTRAETVEKNLFDGLKEQPDSGDDKFKQDDQTLIAVKDCEDQVDGPCNQLEALNIGSATR